MQQYTLRSIYRLNKYPKIGETLPPETEQVRNKLRQCQTLREENISWQKIQQIVGISRAKYFRINKRVRIVGIKGFISRSKRPRRYRQSNIRLDVINAIYKLRKDNPTYGKSKITVILKRDHGILLSESSVGRVITKLISTGKISRYSYHAGYKRKRKFKGHAKRWIYGMKPTKPGEMVQVDHMTVTKNNFTFKHFQAWDPITKVIVADVVTNAKSITAAKFLHKIINEMPFTVKSIQVDVGSEFMKDFEHECAVLKRQLYVLPPKRPQYNGGVERGNRIFRDDFYSRKDILADSLGHMKAMLQQAVHKYNSFRPHFSLKGLTPFDYSRQLSSGASLVSYVLN